MIDNAVGLLLSAASIGMIRDPERVASREKAATFRVADVTEGWMSIGDDPRLRRLFWNTVAVNALIMATEPLLAVLLLRDMGWEAWQYGIAFGLPCIGGFVGARIAPGLAARYGRNRVLVAAGALRAVWPVGLVLAMPGTAGVVLVIGIELALITSMGVFDSLFATERLERVPADRIGRVMVAWNVTGTGAIAALTALWGLCAAATDARSAIGIAGALLLVTPFLLPRRGHAEHEVADPDRQANTAAA